ncbi:MAG: N-acetylmuramoyl-L-alanine amidase [Actinobacteria bacterium]|nr:N-acetylmuramoyl-L-alanine amidase [Actinomycetota bacterium]
MAAVVAGVVVVVALLVGVAALRHSPDRHPGSSAVAASASIAPSAPPTVAATASAAPTPTATPAYTVGGPAPSPAITKDYINFGAQRQAEMGAYALARYGSSDIRIDPKVIVLHYTCGSTYSSAHATFESDAPNMGVKPGVVSQFVIDKDGTIYQQIPLGYMGRHTVGLNHVAIGIECVEECSSGDAQAVSAILHRKAQGESLIALVRWLMYRFHIPLSDVIGHGMANDSPYFKDLQGLTNDHTDWSQPQILLLRTKVRNGQ